jgi:hypothetical protein
MNKNIGLVWYGEKDANDLASGRFAKAAEALFQTGLNPVGITYQDTRHEEVLEEICRMDAIQVWVNPIESGHDRSRLDQVLRQAAMRDVLVHTHPDTILKMGTKRVLLDTKDMDWGSEVHEYRTLNQLRDELPTRLSSGPRVLKQMRGHSGGGIWKVEHSEQPGTFKLRHAQRGCVQEVVSLETILSTMQPYFEGGCSMIEQAYQSRLSEGITRIYMVKDRIGGFGHQQINALFPVLEGNSPEDAPSPGPRLYYPPGEPRFQRVGDKMTGVWLDQLKACLALPYSELPLLWDADLMLGPKDEDGTDTYVLCEINVSSVSPYPEWANPIIAETLEQILTSARGTRGSLSL